VSGKAKLKILVLILPALILALILVWGLVSGLLQSLGYFPALGLEDLSFDYYRSVLSDSKFWQSLAYSFFIAFISALSSLVLGVALAQSLVRLDKSQKLLLQLPVAIPHIVVAFLTLSLLSQTGLVSRIFGSLGLITSPNDFPLMVQDARGIGLIFAYIFKQAPYVLSVLGLVLEDYTNYYGPVARSLGASPRQAFWQVSFPLALPQISTAGLILFAYDFGAYELPLLLGATVPEALSLRTYREFFKQDLQNRPRAMAYTLLLALAGIA
jgi:putative spermidine/putrescine transport system permease protein